MRCYYPEDVLKLEAINHDPIIIWDLNTKVIIDANPAFEVLVGKLSKDIIGLPITSLLFPSSVDLWMGVYHTQLLDRGYTDPHEAKIPYIDGSARFVRITSFVLRDTTMPCRYVRARIVDITEIKKLEDEIKQLRQSIMDCSAELLEAKEAPLTNQETEIIRMIKNGLSTAEIATSLGVSDSTVYTHRRNIRRKLNLLKTGSSLENALIAYNLRT